jgi:hypothetical protein
MFVDFVILPRLPGKKAKKPGIEGYDHGRAHPQRSTGCVRNRRRTVVVYRRPVLSRWYDLHGLRLGPLLKQLICHDLHGLRCRDIRGDDRHGELHELRAGTVLNSHRCDCLGNLHGVPLRDILNGPRRDCVDSLHGVPRRDIRGDDRHGELHELRAGTVLNGHRCDCLGNLHGVPLRDIRRCLGALYVQLVPCWSLRPQFRSYVLSFLPLRLLLVEHRGPVNWHVLQVRPGFGVWDHAGTGQLRAVHFGPILAVGGDDLHRMQRGPIFGFRKRGDLHELHRGPLQHCFGSQE